MTDPIVEHAKATLEIVDLLQMMVAECKCQAKHVIHKTGEPIGPCSVSVVARARHCESGGWLLVCEEWVEYARFIKNPEFWQGKGWQCRDCGTDCLELMPV